MSLKSTTFDKLTQAVDQADPATVEGTEILALSASAVKNLNEGTDTDPSVYQIGTPGEIGFGVATCPEELIPGGWRGMEGHDNILSPNYGNYIDTNGSVLVYVPKHYYKWDGNTLYVSHRPLSGYALDRSFINGGEEISGVMVYKYGATNINGTYVSKRGYDPVSTNTDHNPIANLNNSPSNNYGGLYAAAKSAGDDYFLTPAFHYTMLARLAYAHGKAATSNVACAYADVAPFMPKGNLNNALADVNDGSVTFTPSGYSNCALTGSGEPFAKTTHNGQDCGVADLNGNMWEIGSGFILLEAVSGSPAPTDFLVLKESVDIRTLDSDATAYDAALYDALDLTGIVDGSDGWIDLGNGPNQVFSMDTVRTSNAYRRTSVGIPSDNGVSADGTTEFGNDGLRRYLHHEMACLFGCHWGHDSHAGVFAVHLRSNRTHSFYDVGGRASVIVK